MLRPKPLLRGLLSYVPPVYRRVVPQRTGGTGMAAYCCEVWLKHLVLLHANGMDRLPSRVAELGPGDSLGIGLAALLSGVGHLVALDAVPYANAEANIRIFDP